MGQLPTGTVTFLFTDVEGSTRLLQEHGARYVDLIAEHRRVLREAFAQHGDRLWEEGRQLPFDDAAALALRAEEPVPSLAS